MIISLQWVPDRKRPYNCCVLPFHVFISLSISVHAWPTYFASWFDYSLTICALNFQYWQTTKCAINTSCETSLANKFILQEKVRFLLQVVFVLFFCEKSFVGNFKIITIFIERSSTAVWKLIHQLDANSWIPYLNNGRSVINPFDDTLNRRNAHLKMLIGVVYTNYKCDVQPL